MSWDEDKHKKVPIVVQELQRRKNCPSGQRRIEKRIENFSPDLNPTDI